MVLLFILGTILNWWWTLVNHKTKCHGYKKLLTSIWYTWWFYRLSFVPYHQYGVHFGTYNGKRLASMFYTKVKNKKMKKKPLRWKFGEVLFNGFWFSWTLFQFHFQYQLKWSISFRQSSFHGICWCMMKIKTWVLQYNQVTLMKNSAASTTSSLTRLVLLHKTSWSLRRCLSDPYLMVKRMFQKT